MFHCSLTGTIFIYQGEEIGLCNVPRNWGEEEYKDIETIQHLEGERAWRKKNGKEEDLEGLLREMRETARDNGRTPMQVCLFFFPPYLSFFLTQEFKGETIRCRERKRE